MDLLTFVGVASKRRDRYEERAKELADQHSSLEKLEEEMKERAQRLALRLKDSRVTFSEFKRVAAEDTLVSSLAALLIGTGKRGDLPSTAYSEVMGQMRYLWNFFDDIKLSLDTGRISENSEFAEDEFDWYYPAPWEDDRDGTESIPREYTIDPTLETSKLSEEAERRVQPRERPKGPATWAGVESRLNRFFVTPLHRWYITGEFDSRQQAGFSQMRRIARGDRKVCIDCTYYEALGWVPMGSLPMPGVQCRCHDRCRCFIDYR